MERVTEMEERNKEERQEKGEGDRQKQQNMKIECKVDLF